MDKMTEKVCAAIEAQLQAIDNSSASPAFRQEARDNIAVLCTLLTAIKEVHYSS